METTGPITKKVFPPLPKENEKLGLLEEQMVCLDEDFKNMERARQEAKKQLEAKFQDVYRKIKNTQEFIEQEGKRINDTLLAFQSKFENKLQNLDNRLQKQHDDFSAQVKEDFDKTNQRLDDLDQKIEDEKAERIKQQDDQFKELQEQLKSLQDQIDTERTERTQGEKNILQKLSDESYLLNEALDKEKTERTFKAKELRDFTSYELQKLQKLNEEFNKSTRDEFAHVTNNLEKEMNNRFAHQNQIVGNMSKVISTIQDTLKVIGKDV